MQLNELVQEVLGFKNGTTDRSWNMKPTFSFENDYIRLVRIDSSNKWINTNDMIKQWGIIFEQKKDFSSLPSYRELSKKLGMKITPVTKGKNAGCFGIRLYGMKQDPNETVVRDILNYIFSDM